MSALLDRVRALVTAKGMKTRLAEDLDIPPSRLSEWLAGKYEPSGEITLRLLLPFGRNPGPLKNSEVGYVISLTPRL